MESLRTLARRLDAAAAETNLTGDMEHARQACLSVLLGEPEPWMVAAMFASLCVNVSARVEMQRQEKQAAERN